MESRLRSTARHAPAAFAASVEEPRSRRLFCGPPPCRLLPQRKDAIPERRFASCANLKYSVQITYGRGGDFDPRQEEGGNKSGLATVLHFATSLSSAHGMLPIHQLQCRCGRTELQRLDARAIFLWSKRDPVRSLTFLTKVQTIAYNIRSAP